MVAIPAGCLKAIGDMQRGDPPVETAAGVAVSWHQMQHRSHRQRCGWDSHTRLLVEQSEPTLLRVLARHLGWSGDGFVVLRREDVKQAPRWVLRNVTKFGVPPEIPDLDGVPFCAVLLPSMGILARTPYLEALAAAVVWYARAARCEDATGFPADDRLLERWNDDSSSMWSLLIETAPMPEVLAAIEKHLGLPPWAVQR